ncbi:MAG: hypothetical protein ACMZI0_01500 [Symbiopectobacterium sp.]|uniref:hypothetical protein n=1 Tax=Symbiopectobacterium sp. TaxID=2952789 RepID=UPI0039E8DF6E
MNNDEMEEKLLEHGFTPKNIEHMKKIIRRGVEDGDVEETLFSLAHILKQRFYNGYFLAFVIIAVFIVNMVLQVPQDFTEVVVYFFATFISLLFVFHLGPMNLSYKSYFFLKKREDRTKT